MASDDLRARIEARKRVDARRRGTVCVIAGTLLGLGFVAKLVFDGPHVRSENLLSFLLGLLAFGGGAFWAFGYAALCFKGRMRSPESSRFGSRMRWLHWLWWPYW